MASTTCGRCGRLAHLTAASGLHVTSPTGHGSGVRYEAAYVCPNCKRLSVASEWSTRDATLGVSRVEVADAHEWIDPHWVPTHGQVIEFPDVPPHIGEAAREASLCLSVGAYRAVGALARAVIEATAKDKGAEGRDLYQRIEALAAADHVRRHTKEQAHEI